MHAPRPRTEPPTEAFFSHSHSDGSDYSKIGLKSSTIASSFGKVFRKGKRGKSFKPEDIAKSLLYAISNNIGQIACVLWRWAC